MIGALQSFIASRARRWSNSIATVERVDLTLKTDHMLTRWGLRSEVELEEKEEAMVQLLLTEQRREDPLIVTFDSVVSKH